VLEDLDVLTSMTLFPLPCVRNSFRKDFARLVISAISLMISHQNELLHVCISFVADAQTYLVVIFMFVLVPQLWFVATLRFLVIVRRGQDAPNAMCTSVLPTSMQGRVLTKTAISLTLILPAR
jgi:hypothetical protein